MKKTALRITLLITFLTFLFIACTNENLPSIKDNEAELNVDSTTIITNGNRAVQTSCDITGSTITTPGNAVVTPGTSVTYNYTNNTGTPTNIIWNIQNVNPAGSIIINGSGNTVTVTYTANFISGTITADGTGGTAAFCQSVLNITKLASSGNTDNCSCPEPYFECVTANSGIHPYWRIYIRGLQTNDTFVLSTSNATIRSGISSYVILDPIGPINNTFILYCEVSRRCSNGTIKKKKIYYQNYYGGTRFGGTTGVVSSEGCNINPDPIILD